MANERGTVTVSDSKLDGHIYEDVSRSQSQQDNADARTFPYRIVNMIYNTANFLSLGSQFEYPADCGDFSDVVISGARIRPQGVTVPILDWWCCLSSCHKPDRYWKVKFLEKHGIGTPYTTGAYELDLAQLNNFTVTWSPMHVKAKLFCSATLTLPDKAGRQINVGGWANNDTCGFRLYWPDGKPGLAGVNDWKENVYEVSLQNCRWHPSAITMANGTILVVGGEQGSNGTPVPTLELLPNSGPVLYCDWFDRTDPYELYPFLTDPPSGGVLMMYYNEARILDEVTLQTSKTLPNMLGAVNNFSGV
ncbi:hypothetical protein BP5796_06240 [Coleophoma crateriformis]|uniref:Glyoxal oxidase N-terminal domain-containing protein n=1 Tax=Coleophoma crateriformis TaxID=565419 RepID=A0A3D8RWL2_9HELO|nr:hypothetical protein BP5796_06240 [Coleophoma crateriformis]